MTNLIPVMSSDTAPSGAVIASNPYTPGNCYGWRAADNDLSTAYDTNATSGTWEYDFSSPQTVASYSITGWNAPLNVSSRAPKAWTFEYWNGSAWAVLDTRANQTGWAATEQRTYSIGSPVSATKYRLNISANNGDGFTCLTSVGMFDSGSPPPLASKFVLTILVIGQSLMANYNGPSLYTIRHQNNVLSINPGTGAITLAAEPLAGVDGTLSSFIPELADLILDDGNVSYIVIANVAIGGTLVSQWAAGGLYNSRIATAINQIKAQGLSVSAVLYGQGENDTSISTTTAAYLAALQSVIATVRNADVSAPFFVAKETCLNGTTSAAIQVAQIAAASYDPTVHLGPDMDAIASADRYDSTHLKPSGCTAAAAGWKTAISPYL